MKKITKIMLVLMTLVAMAGMAFAADPSVTWNQIASGTGNAASGSALVNVTLGGSATTDEWNVTNVTFAYLTSASGASYVDIGNATDQECSAGNNCTGFEIAWDTTALAEDLSYTLRATIYNVSGQTATDTLATVYVDNNDPPCTITSHTAGGTFDPDTDWTVTATNASSCTIQFGGNNVIDMTESNDVCTYTGRTPSGIYTVTTKVSDAGPVDTTTCTMALELNEDTNLGAVVGATLAVTESQKQSRDKARNSSTIIIVAIAAYLYFNRKKGK